MITLNTIRTLANKFLEEADFNKEKAIKLCDRIPDTTLRLQVINRIKG